MKVFIGQWKERHITSGETSMSKEWQYEELVYLGSSSRYGLVLVHLGALYEAKWEKLVVMPK